MATINMWNFESANMQEVENRTRYLGTGAKFIVKETDKIQKANFEMLAAGIQTFFQLTMQRMQTLEDKMQEQDRKLDVILARLPITK